MSLRKLAPAFAGLSFVLAGCGFTPMYATPGLSSGLSSVDVVAPQGRVGYLLREDLDDNLARDKDIAPRWRLEMTISQSRNPLGLQIDNVAERYELAIKVDYTLTDLASGHVAHTGEIASKVSYDAADQPYAGIAARQDSQVKLASDAARRIQLDLAAWMATGEKAPPATPPPAKTQ
jgi:LPS-assembly lipoprotein